MPGPGAEVIGEEELAGVGDVLRSGHLARYGPEAQFPAKVLRFEREVARLAGVERAVGVNSGTSALYLALAGLGIGPGDEVIVPGFTFVASISAIIHAGAHPVLAEVEGSFNFDPADVDARITPVPEPYSWSTCWETRPDWTSCARWPSVMGWRSSRTMPRRSAPGPGNVGRPAPRPAAGGPHPYRHRPVSLMPSGSSGRMPAPVTDASCR